MKLLNQPMDSAVVGASLIVLASTIIYFWHRNKRIKYVDVTKVRKLVIYPIKSLRGVEVDQLEVTKNVLKYGNYLDR